MHITPSYTHHSNATIIDRKEGLINHMKKESFSNLFIAGLVALIVRSNSL